MHENTSEAVERASRALDRVREQWMARPEVNAVHVGLLRDSDGAPTQDVGIVVTVDPAAAGSAGDLPDRVDDVGVQVIEGRPAPERD